MPYKITIRGKAGDVVHLEPEQGSNKIMDEAAQQLGVSSDVPEEDTTAMRLAVAIRNMITQHAYHQETLDALDSSEFKQARREARQAFIALNPTINENKRRREIDALIDDELDALRDQVIADNRKAMGPPVRDSEE